MTIDTIPVSASFMDISSTSIRTADATFSSSVFNAMFVRATGVVLLYDITSRASYEHITNQAYCHVWLCKRYRGEASVEAGAGVGSCEFVLIGNKKDVVDLEPAKREVDADEAEQWAMSRGMRAFEVSANERGQVGEAVVALMRGIGRARTRADKEKGEEKGRGKGKEGKKGSVRERFAEAIGKTTREGKKNG